MLSWIIFIAYLILISTQIYISSNPVCGNFSSDFGLFYSMASAAASSGFFFTFIMLLVKICQAKKGKERIPSILALNIIAMGLLFTILIVVFNWGGVCIDELG